MGKAGEEMIKLTIELTDDKFKYSFEVGKTINHGEHPLTPESMVVFTNAVSMCRNSYINQQEEFFREANAKAWLETHPEIKLDSK